MSHAHWRIIGLSWWLLPPSQNKDCLREELRVGRSSLAPAPSLYPAFGWEQLGGKRGFHMNDVKTFTEDDSEDQEGAAAEGWPLATPHVRFPWKKIWAATFSIFFLKRPWEYLFYSSSSFQASLTPMTSMCSGQAGSMATLRWGNGSTHREVIYPRSPQNDRSRTKMEVLTFEVQCSLLGFKSP